MFVQTGLSWSIKGAAPALDSNITRIQFVGSDGWASALLHNKESLIHLCGGVENQVSVVISSSGTSAVFLGMCLFWGSLLIPR